MCECVSVCVCVFLPCRDDGLQALQDRELDHQRGNLAGYLANQAHRRRREALSAAKVRTPTFITQPAKARMRPKATQVYSFIHACVCVCVTYRA